MLHIDSWPSRQSEILCTWHTCVNKRKQSRGWTEMCGCYEMIYTDAHVRYGESSLRPEEIRSVTESASEWLGVPLGKQTTTDLRLSTPQSRSRSTKWDPEYEYGSTVWLRCYWSIQQYVFVSLRLSLSSSVCLSLSLSLPLSLSLSLSTQALTPFENKVWELYFHNQVLWPFFFYAYSFLMSLYNIGSVEYLFFAITPWSTKILSDSTC